MTDAFFERPILNSPYAAPARHWALDADGQPTGAVLHTRRRSELITPVPKPKLRRTAKGGKQQSFAYTDSQGLSSARQEYDPTGIINEVRAAVEAWRALPNPNQWQVTPETARLLQHWRHHDFLGVRPFFCQVEAVETAIWLAEVAPHSTRAARFLTWIKDANGASNPELIRTALKLATGAGKTTVMAMLIAWQTVNAVRHPATKSFSSSFLIVTPGITIKDRLRVLLPNDPESYYRERELVPADMLGDIAKAKIVITNYHAFKLRERTEVSKGTRDALEGWRKEKLQTLETEGQMLQRVMPELMSGKGIVVLNDEAHHCYRERVKDVAETPLEAEEKEEAKENAEAARLWISGIEAVKRKLGLRMVYDLSATPFFLRGSGYAEGTLFGWTMSDFSLMDAIECGIVKLPRVPVSADVNGKTMPVFRELWDHIGKKMPKKGRGAGGSALDALKLPVELQTALSALYGHYAETSEAWAAEGIAVPPVFIVVCNNTATSELVYRYIAGFRHEDSEGTEHFHQGALALFRNYDDYGNRIARPATILVDSKQLESGDALDKDFRTAAADEIERFRQELVERSGDMQAGEKLDDAALLREVLNTVGKRGRLGEQVRCVVSVSMLTEGWDANTVTHILGVRAFGTQLLCEQVVGRALRRQSYDLNAEKLFDVEYADILGIPFSFTAKPVVTPPAKARETVAVRAVRPDRDALEITFPRVEGYRTELPEERLEARFTPDSTLELTPDLVGATSVQMRGLIGEMAELDLDHLDDVRESTVLMHLARHLTFHTYRDPNEAPRLHLFGQLKRIARQWLDGGYLVCRGGTKTAQLLYLDLMERAANRIKAAISQTQADEAATRAILDPYNPAGSSRHVNFTTSKKTRWQTEHDKSHVDWAVCDSDWEVEFCRVAERHPRVLAYVVNQGLGFEVPYQLGTEAKRYRPDFILRVDDGRDAPLNLIVEVKGYRGEDAKEKANTMRAFWVPGVNNLGGFGRWAFCEFTAVFEMQAAFDRLVEEFVAPLEVAV